MNPVLHFNIYADDVERARTFYESVFGWSFTPWGPPDFYLIRTGDEGIGGALAKRMEVKEPGTAGIGYECTVGVEDVDAIGVSIDKHGGRVTMPKFEIPTVGWLIRFVDTEGNVACAMRYHDRK